MVRGRVERRRDVRGEAVLIEVPSSETGVPHKGWSSMGPRQASEAHGKPIITMPNYRGAQYARGGRDVLTGQRDATPARCYDCPEWHGVESNGSEEVCSLIRK